MIINSKTEEGLVYAYICYNVVDEDSRMCDDGKYLFINGFWIHKDYRKDFRKILDNFIAELFVLPTTQNMQYVYWERDKNGKMCKYFASRFVKRVFCNKIKTGEK